jgi:hypothetical protein
MALIGCGARTGLNGELEDGTSTVTSSGGKAALEQTVGGNVAVGGNNLAGSSRTFGGDSTAGGTTGTDVSTLPEPCRDYQAPANSNYGPCIECVRQNCLEVACTCLVNTDCPRVAQCFMQNDCPNVSCGDDPHAETCAANSSPELLSMVNAALNCLSGVCYAECQLGNGPQL